ncbi:unnamed protein product [Adineta ricciae]|uniref:Acetyl-coenzyme A transporter 1 n=1 Tax=Adineta ricciae TaxID=249248 RepID=A0A814QLN6_ADIRI|nr:unnamed protein product [Adineta ricciae]CAF1120115.1 unnamed protein product [Adineta ricciae]
MARGTHVALSSIFLILILYFLQGLNIGLATSIPIFLAVRGANWAHQSIFSFVYYPFSLKLFWAPLIDTIHIPRFGRRKTWLIPIQLCIVAILLLLSFYVDSFVTAGHVVWLAVMFFGIILLTASQDICVDGLAITLFSATNPQWTSTSQNVGQTLGHFSGFSFLLTLESANFTNKYIRQPLSLPFQAYGLFSLEHFIRFAALAFLVVTVSVAIFFHEKKEVALTNKEDAHPLTISETYISVIKLFKKKCMRQLAIISILAPAGLVATTYMTRVSLTKQGVPQANLALVEIPVTLVSVFSPLIIRRTKRPLIWFVRFYALYLLSAIPTAAYVYFTPQIISSSYYYPLLIVFLTCNEFFRVLRAAAQIGFFALISEERIGGTYMTLLATLSNFGFAMNSSAILYLSNWLPKKYDYVIAVGLCITLGVLWMVLSFRTIKRLQKLPTHKWYLFPETITDNTITLEKKYDRKLLDDETN